MTAEHDNPAPPDTAPDTAVDALESDHRTDDADPAAGTAQTDGESALRDWEGLPPEAMILVPAFTAPMRLPEQAWAMLVLAVDIVGDTDPDRAGEVELFAGPGCPSYHRPASTTATSSCAYRYRRTRRIRCRGITPSTSRCCWRAEAAGNSLDGGVLSTSAGRGSSRRPPLR
jgi:hypothetical protein